MARGRDAAMGRHDHATATSLEEGGCIARLYSRPNAKREVGLLSSRVLIRLSGRHTAFATASICLTPLTQAAKNKDTQTAGACQGQKRGNVAVVAESVAWPSLDHSDGAILP